MRPINWGIVGLGRIAHKFTQDLRLVKGARLHAVASRSLDKGAAFAEQYQATHHFGSYEELVNCPDLDVVYIATPHTQHLENSHLFLKNKIAVLCEKPLAINSQQVEKILAFAKSHDTYLMEAMWTRFFPTIKESIALVKSGVIGEMKTMRADFGFHKAWDPTDRVLKKELGGGGILDVGIYPLFLSLLFLGKPKEVIAKSTKHRSGVDDSTAITLIYENEKMASLYCSVSTLTPVEATIYGTKGSLKLHSRFHQPKTLSYGNYYEDIITKTTPHLGNGYLYEIEAVNNDIRAGKKENDLMTHQMSRDLMELLDQVRKAANITYPQDAS